MVTYNEMKNWATKWLSEKSGYRMVDIAYDEDSGVVAILGQKNKAITLGVFRENYDQHAESNWIVETLESDQSFNHAKIVGVEDEYLFISLSNDNAVFYSFGHEIRHTYCQTENYHLEKVYTGLELRVRNLVLDLMAEKADPREFPTRGISQFIKMTGDDRAFAVNYNVLGKHSPRDYGFEVWEEDNGELRYEEIHNSSDSPCFTIKSAVVVDGKMHLHMCPALVF